MKIPNVKKLLQLLLLFALLTACTKEIAIDFPLEETPVISSIFTPKEHFTFYHSLTSSLSENYADTISAYQLKLYENNRLILNKEIHTSPYESNIYPHAGSSYTLELTKGNSPTITATDSIPQTKPYIKEALRIFPTGQTDYGEEYCDISITFNDPASENNFYEIIIINTQGNTNDSFNEVTPTDAAWRNEGDYDYWPSTIFFSDALFNGETYTFRQKYYNYGDTVILRSVSKAYFLYRKFYTRHYNNQQTQGDVIDVFTKGEPQEMYSNIQNGYGNFASYIETQTRLKIIEK